MSDHCWCYHNVYCWFSLEEVAILALLVTSKTIVSTYHGWRIMFLGQHHEFMLVYTYRTIVRIIVLHLFFFSFRQWEKTILILKLYLLSDQIFFTLQKYIKKANAFDKKHHAMTITLFIYHDIYLYFCYQKLYVETGFKFDEQYWAN